MPVYKSGGIASALLSGSAPGPQRPRGVEVLTQALQQNPEDLMPEFLATMPTGTPDETYSLDGTGATDLLAGPDMDRYGQSGIGQAFLGGAANAFDANGVPTESFLDRIRMIESGGDDFAVSSAGARGPYQIMPATGADPGYGVPSITGPAVNDPTQARAWARKYLTAMHREFQDPVLATAAYNAGAGTIQNAGGMAGFENWPAETRGYVDKAFR